MAQGNFKNTECNAGNGRLYRMSEDTKQKEIDNLEKLQAQGNSWATPESAPDYDGYLQISQEFIDWLQLSLNANGSEQMRMNWKAAVGDSPSQGKFFKISGAWIAGIDRPLNNLSAFIRERNAGNYNPASTAGNAGGMQISEPSSQTSSKLPNDDIPF